MRKASLFVLILLCTFLIIAKIRHLSLPFFWDEAWPYSTGAFYMYSNGLSLLPGAVPFDISRGHPLFFHFLAAVWMKAFGTSLLSIHLFPLLISLLLILCTYFFCLDFFSENVALVSSILIMVQPVFLSQSAMLLPEVLVALLTLLSLWAFLREKKRFYILCAVMLLLTKESGIIIVVSLFCSDIFENIYQKKERRILVIISDSFYLLIPFAIASGFFILQKIKTGYFFLPMYVDEENLKWALFSEKLKNYFAYVFIYQGRNALSIFLVLAVAILIIQKITIPPESKRVILPMMVFVILYFLFSSFSFYSPRYMLSVIPLVIIMATYMVFVAADKKQIIYIGFLLVTSVVSVSYCLRKKPVNDHSPGFADGIVVTQSAVNYCEEKEMYGKKIYTNFLMQMHLTHPEHGYLAVGKGFDVTADFDPAVNVYIALSYEPDDLYDVLKQRGGFRLIKRFEKNYAWSEIYERK